MSNINSISQVNLTGDVQELTADNAVVVSPTAGIIDIAGGTNVTTVGANGPGTVTVNLDADITVDSVATSNAATGLTVADNEISADGTDANISLVLNPKGTGDISITAASIVPSTDRVDSLGSATNSWDNAYIDGLTFDDGTNVMSQYSVYATSFFIPDLEFGGASTGILYSDRIGRYGFIGAYVFFWVQIVLNNKGSATGNVSFELPFSVPSNNIPIVGRFGNISYTDQIGAFVSGGSTVLLEEYPTGAGAALLDDTNFANNSFFQVQAFLPLV